MSVWSVPSAVRLIADVSNVINVPEPSHVLTALGIHRETAQTSVRFTLPHNGTGFDQVAAELAAAVESASGLRARPYASAPAECAADRSGRSRNNLAM